MRIQVLGLPTDVNSSYRRGCAECPSAIRRAWRRYRQFGNTTTENGFEIASHLHVDDLGDLPLAEADADHATIVRAAAQAGSRGRLLALGGDHAVTFPLVEGLAQVHGPLNLLHCDAHPDLYHDYEGNPRSHASLFARIL